MTTSDRIKELCVKMNISISELSRRIGQTPQNFNKKYKRNAVTVEELIEVSNALNVDFEQSFTLADGDKITVGNNHYLRNK